MNHANPSPTSSFAVAFDARRLLAQALTIATFVVDTTERVAQRVLPSYETHVPPDGRFYVVVAEGASKAIELALAARAAGCTTIADYRVKQANAALPV